MNNTGNTKAAKFFAYLTCAFISSGTLSKIFSIAGANIELVLGSFFFVFFYLPLWCFNAYKISKHKFFIICQSFALAIFMIAALFKNQHWPGANKMFYILLVFVAVFFIPAFIKK